jgi:hypothetical protein
MLRTQQALSPVPILQPAHLKVTPGLSPTECICTPLMSQTKPCHNKACNIPAKPTELQHRRLASSMLPLQPICTNRYIYQFSPDVPHSAGICLETLLPAALQQLVAHALAGPAGSCWDSSSLLLYTAAACFTSWLPCAASHTITNVHSTCLLCRCEYQCQPHSTTSTA